MPASNPNRYNMEKYYNGKLEYSRSVVRVASTDELDVLSNLILGNCSTNFGSTSSAHEGVSTFTTVDWLFRQELGLNKSQSGMIS